MWCSASTKHFYTNSVHIFDKAAEDAFILRNTLYRERDEARAFATDLRAQLDRALAVIKDLEAINADLLAMVQGEDEQAATTEPAIDWTKPVVFPNWYQVPEGTRVVCVEDNYGDIQTGTKGVTTESSRVPYCDFDNGTKEYAMICYELAPENPADHPWHPEFKNSKGNTLP
jgi:hypothetical protein